MCGYLRETSKIAAMSGRPKGSTKTRTEVYLETHQRDALEALQSVADFGAAPPLARMIRRAIDNYITTCEGELTAEKLVRYQRARRELPRRVVKITRGDDPRG